jgi:hypothetical protein
VSHLKRSLPGFLLATLVILLGRISFAAAADHRAKDEKALRDADEAWLRR